MAKNSVKDYDRWDGKIGIKVVSRPKPDDRKRASGKGVKKNA